MGNTERWLAMGADAHAEDVHCGPVYGLLAERDAGISPCMLRNAFGSLERARSYVMIQLSRHCFYTCIPVLNPRHSQGLLKRHASQGPP